MRPMAGLYSAVGEGLTELFGHQITRVASAASPETQVQTANNTLDYDGVVTLTLTSGAWLATIASPMRVRILSGAGVSSEALVQTRDSGVQVTLQSALTLPGGGSVSAFSGQSFEIVTDADTSLSVESTHGFPSTRSFRFGSNDYLGRIVVDGEVYYYTGISASAFTGLAHDPGTGVLSPGIAKAHRPLAQVDDYSRRTSALDEYWRSFLVRYASGSDLTVLGRNLGIARPEALPDDDVFRALIQAAAYAARGTVYALEGVLNALLGAGNWSIFENLTVGSKSRAVGRLQDGATVFIGKKATASDTTNPYGKLWLDGYEDVPLASPISISPNDVLNIASVQAAPETSDALIAQGSGASSADGLTITFPAASIPAAVYPGDILVLTSGPRAGTHCTIQSRTSTTEVVLGFVEHRDAQSLKAGDAFSSATWEIRRKSDQFGYGLPTDFTILEAGATRTPWAFLEPAGSIAAGATSVVSAARGPVLELFSRAATGRYGAFQRPIRVTSEDWFEVEAHFDVPSSNAVNCRSCSVSILDGTRAISVSVSPSSGGNDIEFGLSNLVTNAYLHTTAIWSGASGTITTPGLNTLWIEKDGDDVVRLWRANQSGDAGAASSVVNRRSSRTLVAEVPYASFPTVGSWGATFNDPDYTSSGYELVFGALDTAQDNGGYWRHLAWCHRPYREWANRRLTSPSANGDTITATGQFSASDLGREVSVQEFTVVGTNGGNALGAWEIVSQTTNTAVVRGKRRSNGHYTLANTSHFLIDQDEYPFAWPNHTNHSVEILTGVNAGTYPIAAILDPVTLAAFGPDALGVTGLTSTAAIRDRRMSNAVLLDTSALGSAGFTVGELDVQWRLVPNFASDAGITAEVAPDFTFASGNLTLNAAPPFPPGTLMRVYYSRVLSAYLHDNQDRNTLVSTGPNTYTLYPAYLYDAFGYARDILDLMTAAGVIPDFDLYYEDASGPHIRS